MQKTEKQGWPSGNRVEPEIGRGAQSVVPADTERKGGVQTGLLNELLSRGNLNAAYRKVRANGGAPGVDGMTVEEAFPYLDGHAQRFVIQNGIKRSDKSEPQEWIKSASALKDRYATK
jgi:hypothetical protein